MLCPCGCGQTQIDELRDYAVLLRRGLEAESVLQQKIMGGGRRKPKAEHLMWSWERAKLPLIESAHGLQPTTLLHSPTWGWVNSWIDRVNEL